MHARRPQLLEEAWDSGAARCCCSLAVVHYSFARASSAASRLPSLIEKCLMPDNCEQRYRVISRKFLKDPVLEVVMLTNPNLSQVELKSYQDYLQEYLLLEGVY